MLKRQGVPKRQRPPQPPRRPAYPSKAELALKLVAQFWQSQPMVKIKCVLADALYGTARFMDAVAALFGGVQVISQLRCNQKVRFRNRTLSVSQYFAGHPGVYHTPCGSGAGIPSPRAWVARPPCLCQRTRCARIANRLSPIARFRGDAAHRAFATTLH